MYLELIHSHIWFKYGSDCTLVFMTIMLQLSCTEICLKITTERSKAQAPTNYHFLFFFSKYYYFF